MSGPDASPRGPGSSSVSRAAALEFDAELPPRLGRVAFSLEEGETLGIVGENGAGKSTTLALVAGLLRPASGIIRLDGRVLAARPPAPGSGAGAGSGEPDPVRPAWVPPHERGVTLLGQGAPLFPHLGVLDNVAFAPRAAGRPMREARAIARRQLAEVDAASLADRRPHELSGGQAQRVAIARALAAEPRVLLLDEPFASIDRASVPALRELLRRVLSDRLAILVTHDPADLVLADRVLTLDGGRLAGIEPGRDTLGSVEERTRLQEGEGVRMPASVLEHRIAVERLVLPAITRATRATETLTLTELAAGAPRTLAGDVTAPIELPPFDNSQMDGYAVRAAELAGAGPEAPVMLPVIAVIAAGDVPDPLPPGAVAAIMTGAPVPSGADAIVPVEETSGFAPAGGRAVFAAAPEAGAFVRPRGSDVAVGSALLGAGARLGPPQLGALAAAGVEAVAVRRAPRVLLVSTGRELVPPGEPLGPGRIHDANRVSLGAAIIEAGALVEAVTLASDDPAELTALVAEADADLLVTTGGVSAGAFEVVREALEPRGVVFGSVAVQPGGPQGLGLARRGRRDQGDDHERERELPVVAFPGNPVSALVSFELFLRPLLRAATGLEPVDRPRWSAPLAAPADSPAAKHQVRRGRLDAEGRVELVGGPSSHLIGAYAASTLLVHLPAGRGRFEAGEPVEVWRIG